MVTFTTLANNCHQFSVGPYTYYVSYTTVIGVRGPDGLQARLHPQSRTTARHLDTHGIRDFPEVSKEQFETLLKECAQ